MNGWYVFEFVWRQVTNLKPFIQFCLPGTTEAAVFSSAGLFAMADNYYTGNLVPQGGQNPPGLERDRVYVAS